MFLPIGPSIRQFARAVTADRLAGDELASAVLAEAGIDESAMAGDRRDIFRRFIVKWRELVEDTEPARPFSNVGLVQSLGPLPSEARMILLLSDICGFGREDVEYVMDPLSGPYAELLLEGRKVVRSERNGAKALIVEDEPLIAADLKEVLESMNVNVVALARTAKQGAREAIEQRPDIVLADYNLDGQETGIDAVMSFQESHACPVVFITGYPDEVLQGDDVEPDFVIVKPYRPEAVQAAVAHCLDTRRFEIIDSEAQSGTE